MKENGNFLDLSSEEESLMLRGKVDALRGLVMYAPQSINADMICAFFGFGPVENEEVKKLREDKEMYWDWYVKSERLVKNLRDEVKSLEDKIAEKEENA